MHSNDEKKDSKISVHPKEYLLLQTMVFGYFLRISILLSLKYVFFIMEISKLFIENRIFKEYLRKNLFFGHCESNKFNIHNIENISREVFIKIGFIVKNNLLCI